MSAIANQVNTTDVELQRVVEAARDALTDEMVTRFAGTASDAVELIDQVNRSGLAKAIPVLAEMVNNGDLDRLAQLARVYTSAEDALTDEMVGRLSEAVGEGLGLLDRVQRSGLEKALPTIARMVHDGDLERLAQLARVYSSAEDALTDEMVGRLAETVGEGLSLVDRLSRGGAGRLVEMMERMESSGAMARIADTLPKLVERLETMEGILQCLEKASRESAKAPPAKGGFGGLWQLVTNPETQDSMRFLLSFAKQLRTTCAR
jgi:uncharacterized protein YjgD (DUF1641 family)